MRNATPPMKPLTDNLTKKKINKQKKMLKLKINILLMLQKYRQF